MRLRLQITRNCVQAFKGKLEDALEVAHGFNRGIDRHRAPRVRISPKVVKAHDVIGMRMGKDYCIDGADTFP